MAVSINKVMLAGNLTRDPELRKLNGDKSVCSFGLAINRRYKQGDEMKEEVTFIDCEAWGRTADLVAQYLTKGRACFVEGRLKLDQWDDKDGQKRSKLKVVADAVQFLDSGKRGDGAPHDEPLPSEQAAATPPKKPAPAAGDDAIPF
jgi:single-strand DNA-binding protein